MAAVIDCDTHYWESVDVWADHIDPAFREQAPTLVQDGERLLVRVGQSIYPSAAGHRGLGSTYGPLDQIHPQIRWDREVSCDPKRRLEFMDEQGIDVHIIFPTLGMIGFSSIDDPALAGACARAYNRFCHEFASADPARLRPVMLLPLNHPQVAVEEMRYARENLGLTATFANPTPPGESHWSAPEFEDLWAAMEDMGVTLAFHESAVGAGPTTVGIQRYAGRHSMLYLCAHSVEPQLALMDMILGGVLVRHPGLRLGLMEAHLSWLPGWLDLLDHIGHRYPSEHIDSDLEPSDIFKRQCFVATFPDDVRINEVADAVGEANVVFSSDWPHKNLTDQKTSLDEFRSRRDLPEARKTAILETSPLRWLSV